MPTRMSPLFFLDRCFMVAGLGIVVPRYPGTTQPSATGSESTYHRSKYRVLSFDHDR